jgi:hypothetical protein
MKRLLLLAVCASVASLAISADEPAAKSDKFYLVEITDFSGTEANEVLDSAAFKKLNDDLKLETRLFSKAVMLAEKEWKADESTKTKMFPRSFRERKFRLINQSTKKSVMDDALSALEEKTAERERYQAEREAKRAKQEKDSKASNKTTGVVRRDDDKKRKSQDERDLMEARAIGLFKSKLEELKTAAVQPKESAGAKVEAPKAAVEPPAKH